MVTQVSSSNNPGTLQGFPEARELGWKGLSILSVLPVPAPARKPWADTQGKLAHSPFSRDLRWAGRTNGGRRAWGPEPRPCPALKIRIQSAKGTG